MNRLILLLGIILTASVQGRAELPDVLRTCSGKTVASREAWESERRPEVLELFKTHVYGRNPVGRPDSLRFESADAGTAMMDGKALRKKVEIGRAHV